MRPFCFVYIFFNQKHRIITDRPREFQRRKSRKSRGEDVKGLFACLPQKSTTLAQGEFDYRNEFFITQVTVKNVVNYLYSIFHEYFFFNTRREISYLQAAM